MPWWAWDTSLCPTATVIFKFSDERLASFTCSYGVAPTAWFQILGTKGDLCVDDAYETSGDKTHEVTVGGRTRSRTFAARDQFAPEILYFSECIQKNRRPEPSGVEGLADVRIIEAIHESARTGRSIQLDRSAGPESRPDVGQEYKKQPSEPKKLVDVEEPSGEEAA